MGLSNILTCEWDAARWLSLGQPGDTLGEPFLMQSDLWPDLPVCDYTPPDGYTLATHRIHNWPPNMTTVRVWLRVETERRSVLASASGYRVQSWSGSRRERGPCDFGEGRVVTISGSHEKMMQNISPDPAHTNWQPVTQSDSRNTDYGECTPGDDYYDHTSISETLWTESDVIRPFPEQWEMLINPNSWVAQKIIELENPSPGSFGYYALEARSTLRIRVRGTPGARYRVRVPIVKFSENQWTPMEPVEVDVTIQPDRWGDAEPVEFPVPAVGEKIAIGHQIALDTNAWALRNCGLNTCGQQCANWADQGYISFSECMDNCLAAYTDCLTFFGSQYPPMVALRRLP